MWAATQHLPAQCRAAFYVHLNQILGACEKRLSPRPASHAIGLLESARRLRFEDDPKTRARGLREALQCIGRWTHFTALDPGDIRL